MAAIEPANGGPSGPEERARLGPAGGAASSLGERDQSLQAAQQAVALEPNLSRTQTVLGYAYLTQLKTAPAKAAFEKALALDQADPLPRRTGPRQNSRRRLVRRNRRVGDRQPGSEQRADAQLFGQGVL